MFQVIREIVPDENVEDARGALGDIVRLVSLLRTSSGVRALLLLSAREEFARVVVFLWNDKVVLVLFTRVCGVLFSEASSLSSFTSRREVVSTVDVSVLYRMIRPL